ncbi:MAG: hypothetical protein WA630_05180 [Mycobacterium sp.]
MTTTSISPRSLHADAARRRSLRADLAFWTAAGAVVAALSGPLAHWWQVSRTVLLVGGLSSITAAAAWFGWLGLSAAGNWALADAAAVMLVLGVWQLTAVRPR